MTENSGHSNGDTTNQEDKDVVKTAAVLVAESGIQNKNFGDDENADRD